MLSCQKSLFSLPDSVHYLNCATMSPNLKTVEAAGMQGILQKSHPYAITQETFFEVVEAIKPLYARLINAPDPQRVAILPSVSYGMAVVARNLPARAGQEILLVHEEFPSDVYAWDGLCHQKNLTLRTVRPPETRENRGQGWNEAFLEAIGPHTALVVVSPVHWSDGTVFDLVRISTRCRETGTWLVLDGTQCVGAYPFDFQNVRPDAVINAGYKWLLGPYSLGLGYFGEKFDGGQPLEENWINRAGSENFRNLVSYSEAYRPAAARYSMGEQSNFILLPMLQAALEQLLVWTPEAVQAYCQELIRPFRADWEKAGYWLENEAFRASHLFGLRPPAGTDAARLRQQLAARAVYVSVRGDSIRVSPHVYNEARDLEAFTEALGSLPG